MARILLIETDRIVAKNLSQYLKRAHHTVSWHVEPQNAVAYADKHKPDLVILDLVLSGRSGIEFLYEFRSYQDWLKIPVVLFSSVSKKELGQSTEALELLNIAAFHYKPQASMSSLTTSIDYTLMPAKL